MLLCLAFISFFITFAFVIELERHIEILLLDNDCVIVPGLGGFMAHYVCARRDACDGAFIPPMRTVGFNAKLTVNDSLLAQSYVEAYDLSYPDAVKRIDGEVAELKKRIEADGFYDLNDIGVLRITEDGQYDFSPCKAGILTPSLYGLGTFELDKLSASSLPVKDKPAVAVAESSAQEDVTADDAKPNARLIALWRNVAVACIAIVVFLLQPMRLDNLQHTSETSIDLSLLQPVLSQQQTLGESTLKQELQKAADSMSVSKPIPNKLRASKNAAPYYTIVLASHVSKTNAEAYVRQLHVRGYNKAFVEDSGRGRKVVFGNFPSEARAQQVRNNLAENSEFAQAWVLKVQP